MPQPRPHNVLRPWIIGVAAIAAIEIFVAYQMFSTDCPAPGAIMAIALIGVPVVYLALMYLTLKSPS